MSADDFRPSRFLDSERGFTPALSREDFETRRRVFTERALATLNTGDIEHASDFTVGSQARLSRVHESTDASAVSWKTVAVCALLAGGGTAATLYSASSVKPVRSRRLPSTLDCTLMPYMLTTFLCWTCAFPQDGQQAESCVLWETLAFCAKPCRPRLRTTCSGLELLLALLWLRSCAYLRTVSRGVLLSLPMATNVYSFRFMDIEHHPATYFTTTSFDNICNQRGFVRIGRDRRVLPSSSL